MKKTMQNRICSQSILKLVSFHIQAHLNAFLQILEYFSHICLGASSERITMYKTLLMNLQFTVEMIKNI